MSGRRRNTANKHEVRSGQICLNGQAMAVHSNGSGGQSKSADVIAARNNRILPDISLRISTSSPTSETSAVDQVMDINRRLLTQIETLRLKVDIDKRHQEASRAEVKADTEAKFKAKNSQLRELKNNLKDKEEVLQNLTARYHQKEIAIGSLEEEIKVLREDVLESKGYADQIQKQLEELQTAATSLESGAAYMEKDEHIRLLQNEVSKLHINLAQMEKELARAKEMIAQQGTKLRLVDVDRLNMQTKYKQDLANVTNMMRRDNEKMRDEMKQQWKQMRELREQNEDMRSDIREIRNLVLGDQPLPQHSPQLFDQTRGLERVNSSHLDLQPLSSALPTLSPKGARKVYGSSRKKT